MRSHEYWEQQAAGQALHALSSAEASEFADHVAECEACSRSVDDFALTAAQLGALAHDNESQPPAWSALRQAVLSSGEEERTIVEQTLPILPTATADNRRSHRRPTSRRILAVAAGVAVLAAAALAGLRLTTGGGSTSALAACHPSGGCHVVTLRSSQTGRKAGTVIVAADGDLTMMSATMRRAPHGRTYVLWQVPRDSRPQAVDEFTSPTAKGSFAGTLVLPYGDLLEFAISSEPANTLPSKPSKIVAVGTAT